MTLDIYTGPARMVDDVSALGLRHVGYGIPTEMFDLFITACVEAAQDTAQNATALEAFRWSLGLLGNMFVCMTAEGSTVVMTATSELRFLDPFDDQGFALHRAGRVVHDAVVLAGEDAPRAVFPSVGLLRRGSGAPTRRLEKSASAPVPAQCRRQRVA